MSGLPKPLGRMVFPHVVTPIISNAQAVYIGQPIKPFPPETRIVDKDGKPTREFLSFLTYDYEWRLRLMTALLGGP
jgi:hypothetical protein